MATTFNHRLNGDLCDAEFARQLAGLVERLEGRVVVESFGGAWLEVSRTTDTMFGVFPVTVSDGFAFRGDTSKRGESGVLWSPGDVHALGVVRRRALRMARRSA